MDAGASMWLPLAMGGMGALGGALGGGQAPGAEGAEGFQGPLHPARLLQRGLGNIENLGGVMTERAGMPVALPSAFVQPTPMFRGGGLPMPIGLSGRDPALTRPALLGLPGVRFPQPDPGSETVREQFSSLGQPISASSENRLGQQGQRWMFPGAPREITDKGDIAMMRRTGATNPPYEGLRQPMSPMPTGHPSAPTGAGGMEGLMGALEMLGVESDELGNLSMGREALFQAAPRRPTTGV